MMHAAHETKPINRVPSSRGAAKRERLVPAADLPDRPPFDVEPIEKHDVSQPTHTSSAKPVVYGLLGYLGLLFLLLGGAYSLSLILR